MMKIQFLLESMTMYERLGIMTLSSILKKNGYSVQLLLTGELSEEECIAKVKEYKPHILAYSITTGEHNYYIDLNKIVRSHYNCFSVFGGPHPTFKPEMVEKEKIDAICRGEGDICFPELVRRMEKGEDFYNIPNFWFKKLNGEIVRNEIGPLVENLDDLPFPDRELCYGADRPLRFKGKKMFMTMRGCPNQCTYCFNHAYNKITEGKGRVIRVRSVDNVIDEIREVKEKYFLDCVFIEDDTFLIKPDGWLEEFTEKFPKEIGLPLFCNGRANLINDKTGKLLKQMNCRNICLGIECANNEIATKILKRNIPNEQIVKACEILHKYRIKILTQNLVGLPVDHPLEIDLETLDLNIRLKPDYAWSSIFYPYPETELGKIAIQKGMFDANFEKIHVSNKTDSALNFGNPSLKKKIVNLHKLFGIIVQFPFLRPFTKFLISLPLTRFYAWLYFAFYGYKEVKSSGKKGLFRIVKYYIPFYLKYVSRLERRTVFSKTA